MSSLFTRAKRRCLTEFAQKSGFGLVKSGEQYTSTSCPCCKESKSEGITIYRDTWLWRWKCARCKKSGTVIDFAAALWRVSDTEAAQRLCDESEQVTEPKQETHASVADLKTTQVAMTGAISRIVRSGYTSVAECIKHLHASGISQTTVDGALTRGMLRFLPADPMEANRALNEWIGNPMLRDSGLLRQESKWPAVAFRPIVFPMPGNTSAEFYLARAPNGNEPISIRYGTAQWPWWWKEGADSVRRIYIVNGIIDLLSRVEVGIKFREAVMGLPAMSWMPEWFSAAYKMHPDAVFVTSLKDEEIASKIRRHLEDNGMPSLHSPPGDLDWNHYLRNTLKKAA